jgi:hypothetical protein
MKKKLDATSIVNELSGQSVFFPPRPSDQNQQKPPQFQPEIPSSTPVRDVRPVPPKKRIMKQRHPFDIYHDQYDTLKQLADEDRRQGGAGSMSAMVREAIDTFIAAKNRKKK